MLTREQYKELKRYEDSEIPIGDEGLSEIEEYLLKCGYIEASRMDVQSCPGIVQFYDSAYQITELGRQALSEYRHERYGKAFQVFLVLLGVAVSLLADILLSLFCQLRVHSPKLIEFFRVVAGLTVLFSFRQKAGFYCGDQRAAF